MHAWSFMMKLNLYLETDASGTGLGAALLQTRDSMSCPKDNTSENTILWLIMFVSRSLTSAEHRYSNIEREALGILHGLKKFHPYCFARNVNIITAHKPLVAIFKKDVATLSQRTQNTSIHGQNIIQARTRNFYCKLVIPTQPQGKQGWGDKWNGCMNGCSTDIDGCPWMHVNPTYTTDNCTRQAFAVIEMFYNFRK